MSSLFARPLRAQLRVAQSVALVATVGGLALATPALTEASGTTRLAAAGGAVLVLAGTLASWLVTARIVRRAERALAGIAERTGSLTEHCVRSLRRGLDALAAGDLAIDVQPRTAPITVDGDDEFTRLARDVSRITGDLHGAIEAYNGTRAQLDRVLVANRRVVEGCREGRLDVRADAQRFGGAYATLLGEINAAIDAVALPVQATAAALDRLAARDLTARVEGHYLGQFDGIQRSFNAAAGVLVETLAELLSASEQVAAAATQISSASQVLAQGATEQAATVEEISATLEETRAMTARNVEGAAQARDIGAQAREAATDGVTRMNELTGAMERIRASADGTARIARTIDEIAFQTNLLALNAAVEAARAGDAGRGFAVVAEEVRALATRAAAAAREAGERIDEAVRHAGDGVVVAQQVFAALMQIDGDAVRVTEVAQDVAAASEQQRAGVSQVADAVTQVAQVTQQAAAGAEESASAAEELAAQSDLMRDLVGRFRLAPHATGRRHDRALALAGD